MFLRLNRNCSNWPRIYFRTSLFSTLHRKKGGTLIKILQLGIIMMEGTAYAQNYRRHNPHKHALYITTSHDIFNHCSLIVEVCLDKVPLKGFEVSSKKNLFFSLDNFISCLKDTIFLLDD